MTQAAKEALHQHLKTGTTTVCRCWKVERKDGAVFGFTDHDRPLDLNGVMFEPEAGFDARVLQSGLGLNVDNSEVLGAFRSESINEQDLSAGKFDGAKVFVWNVNWQDPAEYELIFSGHFGEVTYDDQQFTVELRSLSDQLSIPVGRQYLKQCDAMLGDNRCKVDVTSELYSATAEVKRAETHKLFYLPDSLDFEENWFTYGQLEVLTGANEGQRVRIHSDKIRNGERRLELAEDLFFNLEEGDQVRLIAGCDKQFATCRNKFQNIEAFKGFPFMPGEDWLLAYPKTPNS